MAILFLFIFKKIFTYLFIWLHWVLAAARRIFAAARGLLSSCGVRAQLPLGMWDLSSPTRDQTRIPCAGRQIGFLTTGPPEQSLIIHFLSQQISWIQPLSRTLVQCHFCEVLPNSGRDSYSVLPAWSTELYPEFLKQILQSNFSKLITNYAKLDMVLQLQTHFSFILPCYISLICKHLILPRNPLFY